MDSVARGVRFWQWVRLPLAGRAWASLLGVLGGDVSWGVTLEVQAVVAGLGRAIGRARLTSGLAARLCCVYAGGGSAFDGFACAWLGSQASIAVVGKALPRLGKWYGAELRLETPCFKPRRAGESAG